MPKKDEKKVREALYLISSNKAKSYAEAGRKVGLHWMTVLRWCKREGIKSTVSAERKERKKGLFERLFRGI